MKLYTLIQIGVSLIVPEKLPVMKPSFIFKTEELCEYALEERKKNIDKRKTNITQWAIDQRDDKRVLSIKLSGSESINYMKCIESKINFNKEQIWLDEKIN